MEAAASGTEYSGEVAAANPVVDLLIACSLGYLCHAWLNLNLILGAVSTWHGQEGGSCFVLYSTFLCYQGTPVPQQLNKVASWDGGELRWWLPRLINLRTNGVTSYGWQPRLTGDRFTERITWQCLCWVNQRPSECLQWVSWIEMCSWPQSTRKWA